MNRRNFQFGLAGMLASCGMTSPLLAAGKPKKHRWLPNWKTSTTGGQQLWGDIRYHAGYRIQRHALTGHYRLLNPDYKRLAWGSLDACEVGLAEQRLANPQLENSSEAVIYLHGLFRTRWSMSGIAEQIGQSTCWQSIVLGYPSTRGSVSSHAKMLDQVIKHLTGVKKIHFVAHSLGNLVIRHWLHDLARTKTLAKNDVALGRMVMLGPPNHRPALARTLVPIDRHKIIAGVAGEELSGDWNKLEPNLATPPCDFGILAGGTGDDSGHNPLIPGDDDMIVGVNETRLAGAHDFRVLNVIHATMMNAPDVQQMSAKFLKHGYFETKETSNPIIRKAEQEPHVQPRRTQS